LNNANKKSPLWWVIPGALAGMPMPFIDSERRLNLGGALEAHEDELPELWAAGVRGVVSLLNMPSDAAVYESAGFAFLCLPIPDGGAPTPEQADSFVTFVSKKLAEKQAVAVHCQGGLGRTGTMLAVYLISQGRMARQAIEEVRGVERCAIETAHQIRFLESWERRPSVGSA
jgi:atypical dual specificity phosphatase